MRQNLKTYAKERNKVWPLEIACLGIRELSPYFLEGSHFLSCDRRGTIRGLEDIGKTVDDHTCESGQFVSSPHRINHYQ